MRVSSFARARHASKYTHLIKNKNEIYTKISTGGSLYLRRRGIQYTNEKSQIGFTIFSRHTRTDQCENCHKTHCESTETRLTIIGTSFFCMQHHKKKTRKTLRSINIHVNSQRSAQKKHKHAKYSSTYIQHHVPHMPTRSCIPK